MTQLTAVAPLNVAPATTRTGPGWIRIFLGGLALWLATVVVTFATGNANLVPTIVLVGSFLVPVTFVAFAFRHADAVVTAQRIFSAFIYGGVLGVLGASILESGLANVSGLAYFAIALIEEGVKLAVLWLLARRLPYYTVRDGMVLGAAVGFGFAAFESAGYAFNALFTSHGLSLLNLVETEALRAVLTPFGHGLWTAILGGALFATAARTRKHRPGLLRRPVIGWFLVVAVLHAVWDMSQSIAVWLTLFLTGTTRQWAMIRLGEVPGATQTQVDFATALGWGFLLLNGLIGLVLLIVRWKRRPLHAVAHP